MNSLAFAAPLVLLSLAGCSLGPSAAEKAEAGRISRAIDDLRAASNAQKPELFAALQGAACETPDLCELKRLCTAGYTEHLSGLAQTARAKELIANGGAEAGVAAIQALAAAKTALTQAESQIGQCADAQGAAHRKYKL